jgi:hypothetical protein
LHFYDANEETYSLAIKGLNQNDNTQIVLEDIVIVKQVIDIKRCGYKV